MKSRLPFIALVLAALVAPTAAAQGLATTTQDVTIVVEEVNQISVSAPVTLTFDAATAGSDFDDVTNDGSTYAVTTNGESRKITGKLGAAFASGITLSVELEAPTGATAESAQPLPSGASEAVDLVSGISGVSESGLGITYTAAATAATASNGTGETQTVTFTVTSN